MKRIKDIDLKDKSVVIRLDLNVPVEDGVIKDNSKIVKSLDTLKYLVDNNCKVIILSHFGRVKTEEDRIKNTLKPVAKELALLLGKKVRFVSECYGEVVKKIIDSYQNGEIIMLENTRFMDLDGKKESENDLKLAEYWASLGDIYINDAFGSMHRAHASTAGIAKYLPHAIGLLVEDELNNLNALVHGTEHPFGVFMGGAKVDDKLPIIKSLLERCDFLLVGGGIANSFLKAKGTDIGTSLATDDEGILKELKELMDKYGEKIVLPVDFVKDGESIMDVGEKTIELYKKCVDYSNVMFVNGTCGKFEDDKFAEGTKGLFNVLKESNKKVIVGGGDTVSAVKKFGFENDFAYLSSGGGATLEYIADGTLAALEWME